MEQHQVLINGGILSFFYVHACITIIFLISNSELIYYNSLKREREKCKTHQTTILLKLYTFFFTAIEI